MARSTVLFRSLGPEDPAIKNWGLEGGDGKGWKDVGGMLNVGVGLG